jgi:hypothetical protein
MGPVLKFAVLILYILARAEFPLLTERHGTEKPKQALTHRGSVRRAPLILLNGEKRYPEWYASH